MYFTVGVVGPVKRVSELLAEHFWKVRQYRVKAPYAKEET